MHQILRLLYVDQKTDYDALFRADVFDQQLTREAVGDLLCGVYDDGLYSAESQLSLKQGEKNALQSELKTIRSLLGDQVAPSLAWLEQEKAERRHARDKPERSHNFQRLVRELSETAEAENQIILFTSMIAPEFESEPALLIGPHYTHENKTLRFALSPGTAT